jgi:ubiquinone/menaquinone biosynthesis C-methylase UbiE
MSGWKKKRDVMRRYDTTAGLYDRRYAEEQKAKIVAAMKHVTMEERSLALDAGCGTGLFFSHMATKTGTLVGVDISKKSLLVARKRAKTHGNVGLVLADADNMPFKEHAFNHVFAFTLVQNMPFPAETLKELRRIASGDAVFAVTGLKRVFARKAFEALLENAGLRVLAFEDGDNLKCYVAVCAAVRH